MPRTLVHVAPRLLVPALALAAGLGGCAWVGQRAFEEKRDGLDQDRDGALFQGEDKDCDDTNPERFPGNDEVPYDGWDNDCDGADVVDIDGDGFPGLLLADYLAANPDAEPWPADVAPDLVDCLDDPAVQAQAGQVFPGNPQDVNYDGIDSDCAGDEDFDFDGDGFLPPTFVLQGDLFETRPAWEAYVAAWGLDPSPPPFTDCDDFDPDANPGSTTPDAWYDGVDQNCDRINDFDADADGWMPDEAVNGGPFELYIQKFHGGLVPICGAPGVDDGACWDRAEWGDCLDRTDPDIPQAVASEVHPGSDLEAPYDGVDQNCNDGDGLENDFDADGDGVMPDTANLADANPHGATFDDYVADWDLVFADPAFGDCDDRDPEVFPGALERLGDAQDHDCSGDDDLTPFGFAGYRWLTPRPPKIEVTGSHYILATAADTVDFLTSSASDVGVALIFDRTAGYDAVPAFNHLFEGQLNPQPIESSVDLVTRGEVFWGSTSYSITDIDWTFLTTRQVEFDPSQDNYIKKQYYLGGTSYSFTGTALDVALDDEDLVWGVGCGRSNLGPEVDTDNDGIDDLTITEFGTVLVVRSRDEAQSLVAYRGPQPSNDYVGEENYDVCFVEGTPDLISETMDFTLCDASGASVPACTTYRFDGLVGTVTPDPADDFWALEDVASVDFRRGWHVATHTAAGGGGLTVYQDRVDLFGRLLPGVELLSASVAFDADAEPGTDDLYLVTVHEPSPGADPVVTLHRGDPAVGLEALDLGFADPARPELEPSSAAIFADGDRLMVGVVAQNAQEPTDAAVGWIFLGWPQP